MDVDNSKMANGTNIRLCAYNNANAQQFGFVKVGDTYRIVTKVNHGTKNLSLASPYTTDGANIHQWSYCVNDFWVLERVNFGSAPSYESIQIGITNEMNCAGFALRISKFLSGDVLGVNAGDSVTTVADKTMDYFIKNQPGRTIRKVGYNLNPTYSINSNEYRVALRVVKGTIGYDYHFMIQLNDGKWADKPGESASRLLGYLNPTTYNWGAYNSDVVYFAVSR